MWLTIQLPVLKCLLILDPEDKSGSSPDIKKYDYFITGHNQGEVSPGENSIALT